MPSVDWQTKSDWLIGVFFGLLYTYFLAPGLPWGDSGELIAGSYSLGFSHPPTHPFFSLVSHAISYLIPANVAYRYNVASMLCVIAVLLIVKRLFLEFIDHGESPLFRFALATLMTFLFGLNPIAYTSAMRSEVYGLELLMIVSILLLAIRLAKTKQNDDKFHRHWYAICFLFGLGMAIHPIRLAIYVPVLALLLWRRLHWRACLTGTGFLLLGLSPYFYHFLRDLAGTKMAWGHFRTWEDWLVLLTGNAIGQPKGSFSLAIILTNCARVLRIMAEQSCLPLLIVGLFGVVGFFKKFRQEALALTWIFLLTPPMMAFGLMSVYEDGNVNNPDFLISLSVPLLFLLVLFAHVATCCVKKVSGTFFTTAAIVLTVALLLGQSIYAYAYGHLRNSRFAEYFGLLAEQSLQKDAVVFIDSDLLAMTLSYIHYCEKRRQDIVMLVPLEVTTPRHYQQRQRFDPEKLPLLDTASTMHLESPLLFDSNNTTIIKFMEYVIQSNRDRLPIYIDPVAIVLFKMNLNLLQRSGPLLQLNYPTGKWIVDEKDPLMDPSAHAIQKFLEIESRFDRYFHRDYLVKNYQSLSQWYFETQNYDAAYRFAEAAWKLHPENKLLFNNLILIRGKL